MHDSPLDLTQATWSRQKEVVHVFYKEMWDHANTALVPQFVILTSRFEDLSARS